MNATAKVIRKILVTVVLVSLVTSTVVPVSLVTVPVLQGKIMYQYNYNLFKVAYELW
jgi:hypothetical protein